MTLRFHLKVAVYLYKGQTCLEIKPKLSCIQIRAHNTGTLVSSYPICYNNPAINLTFVRLMFYFCGISMVIYQAARCGLASLLYIVPSSCYCVYSVLTHWGFVLLVHLKLHGSQRRGQQNWKRLSTRQQKQTVVFWTNYGLSCTGIWCVKDSPRWSQQASAKAEASVSPQTCPFVCMNGLNDVSTVSTLAAKVAETLCLWKLKNAVWKGDKNKQTCSFPYCTCMHLKYCLECKTERT